MKSGPLAFRRLLLPLGCLIVTVAILFLLGAAAPIASAQDTWTGSGTFTAESTPSSPACTGSGTASISMDGTPGGSFTADLSFTVTSQSSGCSGSPLSSGTDPSISGTLSGGAISASDGDDDTITGTLTSTTLQMTITSPWASSNCAAYCQLTIQLSMTGSGPLGAGGGFGDLLSNPDAVLSIMAALFGLIAIVLALLSLPGRIPAPPQGNASLGWGPDIPPPFPQTPPPAAPSLPPTLNAGPAWPSMPPGLQFPMVNGPDIPSGAVRLDPGPVPGAPGMPPHDPYPRGIKAPYSGNPAVCPHPGCPLAWNETGWYCLSPGCPYRNLGAPRSQAPAPGAPFGFPQGVPPPPPP